MQHIAVHLILIIFGRFPRFASLVGLILAMVSGYMGMTLWFSWQKMPKEPMQISLEQAAPFVAAHGKSWVAIEGVTWDCQNIVQADADTHLSNQAIFINDAGTILGVALFSDSKIRSCADLTKNITGELSKMSEKFYRDLPNQGFNLANYQNTSARLFLCTYCGPNNVFLGIVVCAILALIGLSFYPLSMYSKRHNDKKLEINPKRPGLVANSETSARHQKRPRVFALVAGVLLILCLCACPIMYVMNPGLFQPMIVGLFPLPTGPSRTPFPVLTAAPFTPGAPTATPLDNEITDPNFIKGVEAYSARQYQKVIDLMSVVIKTHPNLAPPYYYRSMAYWYRSMGYSSSEDCKFGMQDVEKALSINPNYASIWVAHGVLNICVEGSLENSMLDYQKALSLDGSLAIAHQNMAIVYSLMENYQKSLEEYSLALAIDPGRSEAWSGRGDTYYKLEQYPQAISDYQAALSLTPEKKNHIYCYLSYSYFEIKDYQNAFDAAKAYTLVNSVDCDENKLIVIGPRSAYALGDYDQALQSINQALAQNRSPLNYYYRGIILQALGKNEEAILDLEYFLTNDSGYTGVEVADAQARLAKLAP